MPLGLINLEHLISALTAFDSQTDNQYSCRVKSFAVYSTQGTVISVVQSKHENFLWSVRLVAKDAALSRR